jgi:hypothetical protein
MPWSAFEASRHDAAMREEKHQRSAREDVERREVQRDTARRARREVRRPRARCYDDVEAFTQRRRLAEKPREVGGYYPPANARGI